MTLRKPLHDAADLFGTFTLAVVDVRKTSMPEAGKPIQWRLLATHPVTNIVDARRIIGLYRMRWVVEEYFHTQKTGDFEALEHQI